MYTQKDLQEISRMLRKRWQLASIPAALIVVVAVIVFVYGQLVRSDALWMVTAFLTIAGVGYFLFLYGVSIRPARIYRKHVTYMLNGRMRTTTGVLKSLASAVSDREGLECRALMINVGEKDDPEDDRLFYVDIYKPFEVPLGTRITVHSNDKMVSAVEIA